MNMMTKEWRLLVANGWDGAKKQWPTFRRGQKKFVVVAALLSGSAVIATMVLGIWTTNWVAAHLLGIESSAGALLGWSWFTAWVFQTGVIASVFLYLELVHGKHS